MGAEQAQQQRAPRPFARTLLVTCVSRCAPAAECAVQTEVEKMFKTWLELCAGDETTELAAKRMSEYVAGMFKEALINHMREQIIKT